MNQLVPIAVAAWLLSAALLAVEHLYFRHQPRLVRYILGAVALCLGTTLAGVLSDNAPLAVLPWVVASSGVVVIGLYWNEGEQERGKQRARQQGEVIGAAHGLRRELTQSMIDKGETPDGTHRSRN